MNEGEWLKVSLKSFQRSWRPEKYHLLFYLHWIVSSIQSRVTPAVLYYLLQAEVSAWLTALPHPDCSSREPNRWPGSHKPASVCFLMLLPAASIPPQRSWKRRNSLFIATLRQQVAAPRFVSTVRRSLVFFFLHYWCRAALHTSLTITNQTRFGQ